MKKSTAQIYFTQTGALALYLAGYGPHINYMTPQEIDTFIIGMMLELSPNVWVEVIKLDDEGFYKRISNQE
jgi:hypothetical protein